MENFTQSSSLDPELKEGSKIYVDMEGTIRIPLYAFIFVTGLVGNILVIVTLARNRRLTVVTNVFLLNLAVSDLLLGVFCMPFTLVGTLLREFVFGEVMCKLISYVQGVTVALNAWTLVAISMERYYAVQEPLRSRRWQTSTHACKVVIGIWIAAFIVMAPIAWVSKLLPTQPPGKFKCRESWPSQIWECSFSLFLDGCLLAVPLLVMATAYFQICLILRREIPENRVFETGDSTNASTTTNGAGYFTSLSSGEDCIMCNPPKFSVKWAKVKVQLHDGSTRSSTITSEYHRSRQYSTSAESNVTMNMNSNNLERRLAIKKRVTCMLFVVVLEFFICWTPIYIINTVSSFQPDLIYKDIGYFTISFFHLLSFVSSCCNPITYCFMNRNFRREFIQTFTRMCHVFKKPTGGKRASDRQNRVLN